MALDNSNIETTRVALSAAGPIPNAVLYNNAKDLAAAMKAAGVTFGGTSDPLPIGSTVAYSGGAIPTGYLDADGSSQLRASYTDLFNVIGTTYGDGAVPGTTFALPNFTGTYTNFIIKATAAAASSTVVSETLIAVPLGTLQLYAGTVYPTGWARADGTAVSRTTYAGLFAIIGTTYGAGDGSTTFNLPNLLSSGTPSPVYIIKVTLTGSVEPSTVAHAPSHIRAGTDVIDGDRVQVDYVPSAYTRNAAASGAGAVTDLTAHLSGIDTGKLSVGATAGGVLKGTYPNPTLASVTTAATGGTETNVYGSDGGYYKVHTFTGNGTLTVSAAGYCDILVIAGGGGGGSLGGGGGAGGLIYRMGQFLYAEAYTITIGPGGAGGSSGGPGAIGTDTTVVSATSGTLRAYGGGLGGGQNFSPYTGGNGGSGGGDSYSLVRSYGGNPKDDSGNYSDINSQGSFGGPSISGGTTLGYLGGGGGGAGMSGSPATAYHAGKGGDGLRIGITGKLVWYAGGGGGGRHQDHGGVYGGRGLGGGGEGTGAANAVAATANTGGGGGAGGYLGGTYYNGAAGGSGLVVVRYRIS